MRPGYGAKVPGRALEGGKCRRQEAGQSFIGHRVLEKRDRSNAGQGPSD